MRSLVSILVIAITCLLTAALALAQNNTPTPAPTKTPTETSAGAGEEATPVATDAAGVERVPFVPLTQDDLTSLTGNVQRPNGIVWHDGKLYTACTGDGTVYEIDALSGSTMTYIWGIRNAHSLYAENEGTALNLWIPDFQANALNLVTRSGVEPVVTGLEGPWGIRYVDEERFLVSNILSNTVNLLTRDGENTVALEDLASPTGIDHDGETLFVANNGSTRRSIEYYPLDDVVRGSTDNLPEERLLVSGLQNVTGLELGSDGYLYFAYALGTRGIVGRVEPQTCMENGGCTNEQVEIVIYTELAAPLAGLTISPDMRLYIHTMFSPDLYWAQIEG